MIIKTIGWVNIGMINVICVKWGDKFTSDFVNRLYTMVCRNLNYDFKFYCYTDNSESIRSEVNIINIPEENELEVWWNKLALFQQGMFNGTCLFFDLDVVIQNNIDHIIDYLDPSCLTKVKSYWKNDNKTNYSVDFNDLKSSYDMTNNSSVMLWEAEMISDIWEYFLEDSEYYMLKYRGIDRFIYHEGFKPKTFPRGIVYSRLFGFDLDNGGPRITKEGYNLYKDDTYPICIFNSYESIPDPNNGTHIDDSSYHGFEHYWK